MTLPIKLGDNSLRVAAEMADDYETYMSHDNRFEWFRAVVYHIAYLREADRIEAMKGFFDAMPRDPNVLPREPAIGDTSTCRECWAELHFTGVWEHVRRQRNPQHTPAPGGPDRIAGADDPR